MEEKNAFIRWTNLVLDRPAQTMAVFGVFGVVLAVILTRIRGDIPESIITLLTGLTSGGAAYHFGERARTRQIEERTDKQIEGQ